MMNRKQLQDLVISEIVKNRSFVNELVAHPDQAIKKVIQHVDAATAEHLAHMHFKVVIEKQGEVVILIPAAALENKTLSEEALKKLSGGLCHSYCQHDLR